MYSLLMMTILADKPNPQAMETLRKAMHEEGPLPGIISLTVARQRLDQFGGYNMPPHSRDSFSSLVTTSSDDAVREYHVSKPAFQVPNPPHMNLMLKGSKNPVVERLMGRESAGKFRRNQKTHFMILLLLLSRNCAVQHAQ